ncbi:MAG: 3-oxoacyl-[acyl-carrier-protein] reductase [Armatimonadetes bacterium]|nr:3-oxoacyl-[acyl-carrier-protein] reductase [Armatimonadota bacterium]MBX3108906.1 3-oxoacyl-[acyl-carrier-protein] reductase [Fimbriimonadaceae bacterium]
MTGSFSGKVVAVTGASRGIGAAIAEAFAASGASVACLATTLDNAARTRDRILESGGHAAAYAVDVADQSSVQKAFGSVESELGSVSILVNNAGITRDGLMMRMKAEDWDSVLGVNLKGAYLCTQAVMKGMMKARWGRIVNITSVIGLHGASGQANYAASKAGLLGLTMSTAKELGSRGITCNAVAPGFIETDMTSELPEDFRSHVEKTAPAGRLGLPGDIAGAVLFLAGEGAGYVTGQCLTVDGGLFL